MEARFWNGWLTVTMTGFVLGQVCPFSFAGWAAFSGFGRTYPALCRLGHGLVLGLLAMDLAGHHALGEPALVVLRTIGRICPDTGSRVAFVDNMLQLAPITVCR